MSTYILVNPILLGAQPIDETSTTQRHPLGMTVTAYDETYGEAQFIYAKGVASTEQYDWVTLNPDDWSTARLVAGAAGRVGISMSANLASQYGWYQVSGKAVGKALAGYTDNAAVYATATAGSVDKTVVAGDFVSGALGASAVGTPSAGLAEFELDDPRIVGTSNIAGAVSALTDNSGGAAADGTIGVVTAPTAIGATLTDSSGYNGTHDDTVAAVAAITNLTDNTGQSAGHDDTLAATTLPATLTDNTGDSGTHDDTLADGLTATAPAAVTATSPGTGADATTWTGAQCTAAFNDITALRATVAACVTDLGVQNQNDSDVAQKVMEHNTLIGVVMQNASDTAQKVMELVTREAVTEQNISDVAAKVIELVTAQGEDRTAIIALTDAVKELSTKINAIIAA